jgi:hypothetical protein
MSMADRTLHAPDTSSHWEEGGETTDVYRESNSGICNGVAGCPQKVDTFEVLEPYDGKLSRPVLRGVWGGNTPDSLG